MSLRPGFRGATLRALIWLGPWLALPGCKLFDSTCAPDDRSCLSGGTLRSGQACLREGDCAQGLDCEHGTCTFAASTGRGGRCVASAECRDDLYCAAAAVCQAISSDPQGPTGTCASSADCDKGLACDVDLAQLFEQGPYAQLPDTCRDALSSGDTPASCELPRTCTKRGKGDLDSPCERNGDCLAGLYCLPDPLDLDHASRICTGGVPLSIEPPSSAHFRGAKCPADAKTPTAYFEVPRTGKTAHDFYRLPFPNDIRRSADGIDLRDHPTPPADLEPAAAARLIQAASTTDGFATNPTVYFRFSEAIDSSTASFASVRIVDITQDSPDYAKDASIVWRASEADSNYICPHWLALHRPLGSPLRAATTYAALVTTDVKTRDGSSFARSPDFEAMLDASRPSDADLVRAWERYAPLRAYLEDKKAVFSADRLLDAAVFTTQDPTAILPKLRAAVEADGAPTPSELTVCDAKTKSPCEDATGRGACHPSNEAFVEIHGKLSLPVFQEGQAPYETPEQGGGIAQDAGGNPQIEDHVDVCFGLSLPKTAQPAAGYPVLLFAHGTGGAFSDPMGKSGLSAWAATLETPSAVLAIDLPEHGSRRGGSTRPPEDLFFNLMNPAAARGNVLQGAADLIATTLLVQAGISEKDAPSAKAIVFDPTRVALLAHSQGAMHAALMLPYESRIQAAVLSGLGGHLTTALRLERKPVDLSSVLPFLLFDPGTDGKLVGADINPMLALIQGYFEQADPINYASLLYSSPPKSANNGHDVFMTYGLDDAYTPEESQRAYAFAAGLQAVAPDLSHDFQEVPSPAHDNVKPGTPTRTVALRTYDPVADTLPDQPPQDGHFVAFSTVHGAADVRRFLAQALRGQTPQIGE